LVVGSVNHSCPQFRCQSTGHCIFNRYRCDGLINCFDASDELGCGMRNFIESHCTFLVKLAFFICFD